jgi:hypothetical protein
MSLPFPKRQSAPCGRMTIAGVFNGHHASQHASRVSVITFVDDLQTVTNRARA